LFIYYTFVLAYFSIINKQGYGLDIRQKRDVETRYMCSGLIVNKTANSRINLIFVGAFHPKSQNSR